MSRDIGNGPNLWFGPFWCCGGCFGCSGGLVVAGGVEGESAQQLAGGGVDDADVEVLDEQDDVGAGVGSADADVVKAAVDAQGQCACFVDLVVS